MMAISAGRSTLQSRITVRIAASGTEVTPEYMAEKTSPAANRDHIYYKRIRDLPRPPDSQQQRAAGTWASSRATRSTTCSSWKST